MKNNIGNIISLWFRQWLEIPVNGTLKIVTQSKRKYGFGHTQCQVTFRNKIMKSNNHNTREVHESTKAINVQCDQFNSRETLKQICSSDKSSLIEELTSQSFVVKSM